MKGRRKIVRNSIQCTILVMVFLLTFGPFYDICADDDHHKKNHGDEKGFHKDGYANDDNDHETYLKPVANQTYKETCGACHFAYQPGLLPSGSWVRILNNPEDHFGETLDIDAKSKKTIGKYLTDNAAEHSSAKRAVKIMKSLRGQTPSRITEIPYIRHKHQDIPPEVFSRKSVGSLSNCSACHRTADQGIYEDDNVVIPK